MIDRAELTGALEVIWQRVRRLNRYVEERAPWQLAKDDARAEELDRVLATLVPACACWRCSCTRTCPPAPTSCSARSGCEDRSLACARWDSTQALGAADRHSSSRCSRSRREMTDHLYRR